MADTKISAMTPAAALTGTELVPLIQGGANVVATAAALAATPTNFTEAVNTSAPNATIPVVSLTASNAAAIVDLAIVPKGGGAVTAQVANNLASGGNKRGANAVDWQTTRSAAARVASGANATVGGGGNNSATTSFCTVAGGSANQATGANSTVCGGGSNTASGSDSVIIGGNTNAASQSYATVIGGNSNTASGIGSVAGGGISTASGSYSFAFGDTCTADNSYSISLGRRSTSRGIVGVFAYSNGFFGVTGDSQTRLFVLRASTTSATPAVLTSGGAASTANQIVLPNTSLFTFSGQIGVRENATGDSKGIEFKGAIKRGANAAATALMGVVTQADLGTPDVGAATWLVAFTADTTNGALAITVTGEAAHNLNWVAQVTTTEVVG